MNNIFQEGIKRVDFAYFMIPFGISYITLIKKKKKSLETFFFLMKMLKNLL